MDTPATAKIQMPTTTKGDKYSYWSCGKCKQTFVDVSNAFATGHTSTCQGDDNVNQPRHYTSHASRIECIQITEHMSFTLGNAIKYIWRADLKNGTEDLEKAVWYLKREIAKREGKTK